MSGKGLSISEALRILNELPDDVSEFTDSSSNTEEYYSKSRDISDDEDIGTDEDGDAPSLPGTSAEQDVIWHLKKIMHKSIPAFTSPTGPSEDMWELPEKTPIEVFLTIFSIGFMKEIVFQTNLYATQSEKPYAPLTLEELYIFLGINLLMGIKKMPSYADYWANEEALNDSFVSSRMSFRRFKWILSNLHLNDNTLEPKRGDENFDKLYKVRPLLTHLSERFLNVFHPSENQSIDESMIKFKGRSTIKQYMPKKPIKRGFKVWMRCNDSGFASQFEIYSGKREVVEKHLGENVVKRLTESLYGKNHKLFMDNFFTTYELFRFLETKNIYSCGTVILSRKNMPKTLIAQDKNLKRGEFDWAVSNDNIICLKWKDKRCVSILSSLPDAVERIETERRERDGKVIKINCPKAISTYNKNMGFVDNFDHMKSLYEIDRKTRKWWHRIFFHFLDVAVVNSYILHKILTNNEIRRGKDFRLNLLYSLCSMGTSKIPKPLSPLDASAAPPYKLKVSKEKRYRNVEHIPIKCTRRRCAYCSTKKNPHRSRYMCKTCNVGLCFLKSGSSCFEKYHSEK